MADTTAAAEYDYAAGFRAIDADQPGVGGCFGCFRCRAGDHGTCHGCSCPCGWRNTVGLRESFGSLIPPSRCPEVCGS